MLPKAMIMKGNGDLRRLLAHELCHVLCRADSALRDNLYAVLGFERLPSAVVYPAFLEGRRITNPDAPVIQHGIRVKRGEGDLMVVPVISLSVDKFDSSTRGEFFNFLELHLLPVDPKTGAAQAVRPADLIEVNTVSGFFEKIGRNTDYIIHPEEILADNFALLMLRTRGAPSPEILERLRVVLSGEKR